MSTAIFSMLSMIMPCGIMMALNRVRSVRAEKWFRSNSKPARARRRAGRRSQSQGLIDEFVTNDMDGLWLCKWCGWRGRRAHLRRE